MVVVARKFRRLFHRLFHGVGGLFHGLFHIPFWNLFHGLFHGAGMGSPPVGGLAAGGVRRVANGEALPAVKDLGDGDWRLRAP